MCFLYFIHTFHEFLPRRQKFSVREHIIVDLSSTSREVGHKVEIGNSAGYKMGLFLLIYLLGDLSF